MAGLQYMNNPRIEDDTHGYSAGISSGAINDWIDAGLTGSHTSVIYWDDGHHYAASASCRYNESRVYMTITDTWRATVDSNTNAITIHVDSSFSMNRQMLTWGGNGCWTGYCWRDVHVFDQRGGRELYSCSDCLSNTGVFCSGSRSFDITLQHGQSTSVGTYFVKNDTRQFENVYYDLVSAGLRFRNTLPSPKYTPSADTACSPYSSGSTIGGSATITNIDYGCPAGNDCSPNSTTIELFSDSNYTNRVSNYDTRGGSATVEYKGLTPNHTYFIRYTITNGTHTKTYTCSFTTMASSYPYGYKFVSDQVSWIYLQINNGDGACDISTKLYIREKGQSSWNLIDTTTSTAGIRETLRNLISRGKQYEAYSTTTNCAGTYTSAIYSFAPPATDSITGVITSYSSTLQPSGLLADLDYCYNVTSYALEPVSASNPITSHLEYSTDRVTWTPTDDVTSTTNPAVVCDKITGLQCNTTYYLRSYQSVGDTSTYSAVVQLTTPTCANFNNCVCDNLHYMTELICQQLFRVKTGVKTVYANCDSKELCDPYSNNPTIASILSRLLRFDQAVVCLLCSMEALDIFKTGETDQVFTATTPGEQGQWITLDYYPKEGSDNLIASSGVAEAIQDYVESVFHPIGTYDYWAADMTELEEQSTCPEESGEPCYPPSEGDRAIIGENYYTYTNGVWTLSRRVPDIGDFAVVTILKGTYTDKNFYWWDDEWKLLNITDAGSIEDRIAEIEEATSGTNPLVQSYDDSKLYKIAVIPYDGSTQPPVGLFTPDGVHDVVVFTTVSQLSPTDIGIIVSQ